MTIREAAKKLKVSERSLGNWIRKKGCPAKRYGFQKVDVDPAEVERWLKEQRTQQ